MKSRWFARGIAALAALVLSGTVAAPAFAGEPAPTGSPQAGETAATGNQHGLTGAWYNAKEGAPRDDMTRFEYDENNLIGVAPIAQLNRDGQDFHGVISQLREDPYYTDYALAKFTGELEVPADGNYTFYMIGDDGFRLFIDGKPVIDHWQQDWDKEQNGSIQLTKGRHDISVDYFQGWGGAYLEMSWESSDAGIEKQVVPADAFWQTPENLLLTTKTALGKEIKKESSVYEERRGNPGAEALKAEIDKAQKLYDADYSHATDIDAVVKQMEAETDALANAKTEFYKQMGTQPSEKFTKFQNPLYQGQDPFVTQHDGFYYFVASSNLDSERKVYVSKSRTLTDQGEKKMIMDMSQHGQARIFAPEMFYYKDKDLGGRWYIYYCADVLNYEQDYPQTAKKYKLGDEHHVVFALRSKTEDPMGEWEDMGPLYAGENGTILGANDVTSFEYDGSIYLVWGTLGAGSPVGPVIARMDNPWTISEDRHPLDFGGEGPVALKNAAGDLYMTTSDGDYHTDGYHLSIRKFMGKSKEDLLDKSKWGKSTTAFSSSSVVSGPARASFVKSADGTQDWMVYHSRVFKALNDNTWREVNAQQFTWNKDGSPNFGTPVSPNELQSLPSGDPGQGDMYQAENAILDGGAQVESTHFNHQGSGYVTVPEKVGAGATFSVNAKDAGDYIVGMRYAYPKFEDNATTNGATNQLPTRATLAIYVNGKKADTLEMDKTNLSGNEYFTGSKRLALKQGQNLISYQVSDGTTGGVDLDYLTMYKADVPYTAQPATDSESGGQTNGSTTTAPENQNTGGAGATKNQNPAGSQPKNQGNATKKAAAEKKQASTPLAITGVDVMWVLLASLSFLGAGVVARKVSTKRNQK